MPPRRAYSESNLPSTDNNFMRAQRFERHRSPNIVLDELRVAGVGDSNFPDVIGGNSMNVGERTTAAVAGDGEAVLEGSYGAPKLHDRIFAPYSCC